MDKKRSNQFKKHTNLDLYIGQEWNIDGNVVRVENFKYKGWGDIIGVFYSAKCGDGIRREFNTVPVDGDVVEATVTNFETFINNKIMEGKVIESTGGV